MLISGRGSYEITAFALDLGVHEVFVCVSFKSVKPCWPSKSNALGACLPSALQDLWAREPDVGLRTPLREKLCNVSILQFVGH